MTWARELSIDSILPDPMLSDLESYLDSDDFALMPTAKPARIRRNAAAARIRRDARRKARQIKESLGYMAGV